MNPSLLSAEGLSGLLFLAFAAATLIGALIAVSAKRLIRNVAGLALSFLGVAGIYYFLNSPFVALMQILIYVGAICVTLIFAIMLAESSEMKRLIRRNVLVGPLAFISCGILAAGLIILALRTNWQQQSLVNDGSVAEIGRALLGRYGMSFELISLVLLVAVVGSLVLGRAGRSKS